MRVKLMRPCLCLAWLCLSSVRFSEFKFSGKRPLDLAFGEEVPILFLILIRKICGYRLSGRFDGSASALAAAVPAAAAGVLPLCLYALISLSRLASVRDA